MDETSEISVEGEADELFTTSMATLPSLVFPHRVVVEDDENEEEEGEFEDEADDTTSENIPSAQSIQTQPLLPEGSFYGDSSSNVPLVFRSVSAETLAGPDGIPYRSNMSFPAVSDELSRAKRLEAVAARKKAIQNLHLPTFEVKLERLKGVEKFDAFSEDEEPVLRRDYRQIEREPECPELDIREEQIIVYNVRKEGVPQFKKLPRWDMNDPEGVKRTSASATFAHHGVGSSHGRLVQKVSSLSHVNIRGASPTKPVSAKVFPPTRKGSIRKSRTRTDGRRGVLNPNFNDTTPHQRDLFFVSYEELSRKEVAVIKGLWKCVTYDLWTFGVLTTINLFKLRGHITAKDPKATPDVMMECRFLWPHANHVMKALESVVMNLSRPSVSHKLVYEVGRKHWKLKIPITEDQKQLMISAFMYTFADHVHPRPNLNEMRTMRKFCSITMFLFADASRWDSQPLIPF